MEKNWVMILLAVSITCINACFDLGGTGNCEYLKVNGPGFCIRRWGKSQCRKTCQYCVATTTTPPPTVKTLIPPTFSTSCGISKVKTSRIINGVNSLPGEWPWMASFQKSSGQHNCGGSLISPKWVLTAAHCVNTILPSDFSKWSIKLGSHNRTAIEASVQSMSIKRVITHPQHGSGKDGAMSNDIALVELVNPAILNDRVSLPCLPISGVYPSPGKQCYITGWGSTENLGNASPILQQAKLPVVSRGHQGCRYYNDVVCVGYGFLSYPNGTQYPNACRGDSGGPLVCQQSDGRWQLEGVASFVHTYCKYYTAYSPVNKYIGWIYSYV